ncbi:acetyl esterase/lipase [Algoriphagus boseongensis]|uniref:Acetyl esterase/lipase n=1 Tax=Algoriphagus boseongensis TaxID=1442587 RepID=A0A4R6T383_9BACT|nr:alpha/beta hydrolase [Algoriphagus boseongensis]TDQ16426.1 acetyl esterase/lipase [Algoriphagus boseongensis]
MNYKKNLFFSLLFIFLSTSAFSQEKITYKKIDTLELTLEIYRPNSSKELGNYPALVFFFGGGWNGGSTAQFEPQAKYFSERGMVCFLVDYRVNSRNKTSPFESLMDAKSAMRFIRAHAEEFQIDPSHIVAAGGSAGGHLAAATALIESYNDPKDDLTISCKPNALVLFNPVIDNGPGGYGFERIGAHYKEFSPLHNIQKGAPPTVIFLGTKDELIPVKTMEYYQMVMEKVGSRCELYLYEDQVHGFFNYRNFEFYKETLLKADEFLVSLGLLDKMPKVEVK